MNFSSKPSYLKCHAFISGCPVAMGSYNLFARAPVDAHPRAGSLWHQEEWPFTGRDGCSWSLQSCHCLPTAFSIFPERDLAVLCPTLYPAFPLLHTNPKKVASSVLTSCDYFSSRPLSAFLFLRQLPTVSASCSQTLFAGQTLKLHLSQRMFNDTSHVNTNDPREFTRNTFNN